MGSQGGHGDTRDRESGTMHGGHSIVEFGVMMRLSAHARQAAGPAPTERFITGTS
jgi:hypothetical protein